MGRVLGYLGAGGCLMVTPHTAITTPLSGAAFNTIPHFGGTAGGVNPIDRVEVRVRDPVGRYWDGTAWITVSRWLTALGTTAWRYPLPTPVLTSTTLTPALDQGEHHLWARAWDTANISDTTPAFASFIFDTISPTTPTLIAPASGITLTAAPTGFLWRGPPNDAGSALSYNLNLDSRILTLAVTYHTPLIGFIAGEHTWRVRAFDAAGNRSPWTDSWTFFMDTYDFFLPVGFKKYTSEQAARSRSEAGVSGQ
jgi:hypothetical protein